MKQKITYKRISIIIIYFLLIGFLVFQVVELRSKYEKENIKMISEVELLIEEALQVSNDDKRREFVSENRETYQYDLVIQTEDEIILKTVPYEKGESLSNRVHEGIVAKENTMKKGDYTVWYVIYHLSEIVFIKKYLQTILLISLTITAILGLSVVLFMRKLFSPLRNIKESIEHANNYDFDNINDSDDEIGQTFKTFVSALEDDISAVSREHTQLEKQLQKNHEHLNNVAVVSRLMIHDLKTPIHRNMLENDRIARHHHDNDDLLKLVELNNEFNHEMMLYVNQILKMLKHQKHEQTEDKQDVDVIQVINQAIESYSEQVQSKALRFKTQYYDNLNLFVEESSFVLLVNSIISNLVEYSNDSSTVNIQVKKDNGIRMIFDVDSDEQKLLRLKSTESLFNKVKSEKDEDYVYSKGNGLYLTKELSLILDGSSKFSINKNEARIEVLLNEEA